MTRWDDVVREAPELAARAMGHLDAGVHKTIATLRADGAPRISGTELIVFDGELWLGSMWRSAKARDLLRDPRMAIHSASPDPDRWTGDATVSGTAHEVTDPARAAQVLASRGRPAPPGRSHIFRISVAEVLTVRLGDPPDHLIVEVWTPDRGLRRMERR